MFRELREDAGLTRADLSQITGRSVNYLLKAEDHTFPTPPVALINYWVQQGLDRHLLTMAYYDNQRRIRQQWLANYVPKPYPTAQVSFCRKWHTPWKGYEPTQYAVSKGLCVPASAVYHAERKPGKPLATALHRAVGDLITYCETGEFSATGISDNPDLVLKGLLRIRSEMS